MKATSCSARGIHLSELNTPDHRLEHHSLSSTVLAGLSGALILWTAGCASDPAGKITASGPPGLPDQVRLNLGTIGITEDTARAGYAFETGEGVLESRGERATRYAANTLNSSTGTPDGDLLLSPITLVLAPFTTLAGAIGPDRKMDSSQMLGAQLDLTAALDRVVSQEQFQAEVIRAAKDMGGRELIGMGQARGDPGRVQTLLKTRIEQVSLERLGKSEKSFALKIKTRNRLVRASDGMVLYDRPMEYCSKTDLFIDWTRATAIELAMKTGIRQIARDLTAEMLSLYDTPVLAGELKSAKQSKTAQSVAPLNLAGLTRHPKAGLIPVADTGWEALGIFTTAGAPRISVADVSEGEPDVSAGVQKTESMLDGLDKHPNYGISLLSIAVAVPVSMWNQSVEAATRLSPKTVRQSSDNLRRAAQAERLDEQLALEVAQNLAPQTAQPLVLVSGPLPIGGDLNLLEPNPGSGRMQFVSKRSSATRLAGTAIQIRITEAALRGEGDYNPRLSLSVKGEADLVRLSDGVKLCSFPMEYRSKSHRYTTWAAKDADLFRKELKRGYSELGKALADHLVTRGIVPPERSKSPLLARN
jgi:hypothetical protein